MDDLVKSIVEKLYAGVISQGNIEDPITLAARHFPDIRFAFQAQCVRHNDYYHTSIFNFDDAFLTEFLQVAELNPFPQIVLNTAFNKIGKTAELLDPEIIERTDFYHACMKDRDQLNHGSGLILHRNGTDAAFIAANIPKHFSETDENRLDSFLETIRPHFQNAFQLLLGLNKRKTDDAVDGFWLDQIPSAALIVQEDGAIKAMNGRAEQLLEKHPSLHIGRLCELTSRNFSHRLELEHLIKKAAITSLPQSPLALADLSGRSTLVFAVPVLNENESPAFLKPFLPRRQNLLLTVLDPDDVPPRRQDIVRALLGLTAREAALVMELVEGKTLRETADSLGMAYNTARTHIANATGRAGLRSQTDLVRLGTAFLSRTKESDSD